MDDDNFNTGPDAERGRQALIVLGIVFVGGLVLIGAADRIHHLGPTLGNIAFVALPFVAALAAAAHLRRH